MPACVFCGSDDTLTKEHVFPEWVRSYLQSEPGNTGTHRRTVIRDSGTTSHSRPAAPATLTVRAVCADCNNGWMSRLESTAKPYLLPMIQGRKRALFPPAQRAVATWAVKTALVAGSKFEPRLPATFYHEFYAAGRPTAKTRVWLGHAQHLEVHTVDWRPLKVARQGVPLEDQEPPDDDNAFQAVLSVGHLAMWVVGWIDPKPDMRQVLDEFGPALTKLWPADQLRVSWPPSKIISLAGLDALADILAAGPTADQG